MPDDYESDLAINKNRLDEEWLKQPTLFMHYLEALADAQLERDKAKERVDVARSKADKDIRANPGDHGLQKVTEASVSNAINEHKKYKQ